MELDIQQLAPEHCEAGQDSTNKVMDETLKCKWKFLFFIPVIIVQATLLMKCILFILRQISPYVFLPQACNKSEASIGQQYLFTMVVYSTLFIGRWLEGLVIHIHIYKFFFSQLTISPYNFKELCKEGLRRKYVRVLFVILILYMSVHSISIPFLGIALEVRHGQQLNCEGYIYQYHVVYWILDIVRYLHDIAVRLLMFLATIVIGILWSESKSDTEAEINQEPETFADYLIDRNVISEDHQERMKDYVQRGSKVECILEIFQTWFTIPWVLYFISSSLDTDHILRSWKDGSTSEAHYDFSEVSYMVYNFNQLFLLTLAFLCSKKMNTHHCNYLNRSQRGQLEKFQTASRMALASINKIEKEDHFDFVPRIWGTSIKVPVEGSLYIIILLVSVFFTVCEALI